MQYAQLERNKFGEEARELCWVWRWNPNTSQSHLKLLLFSSTHLLRNNAPISSGKNPKMRQPWFSFFCSSDRFVDNKFYTLHLDFLLFPEGKNKSGSLIRFLSFIYCFSQKIIRQSQKYKKTKGLSILNTKIIWWLHLTLRLRYGGGEGKLPSCCVWK